MKVLDHGSIDIVEIMGSDRSIVNCARVSFSKDDWTYGGTDSDGKMPEKDQKLLAYLVDNKHVSPFYHAFIQVRVCAPISVQRQWVTHKVGTAMNSESTRYSEIREEFYIPEEMRAQSTSNKQGSSGVVDGITGRNAMLVYIASCEESFGTYRALLDAGVAKELAREVLPLCTYTSWVFTFSLQALAHFLRLREDSHAQYEIRQYANALHELAVPLFPISLPLLLA